METKGNKVRDLVHVQVSQSEHIFGCVLEQTPTGPSYMGCKHGETWGNVDSVEMG